MDSLELMEKLSGLRFADGLPVYKKPEQAKAWETLVEAKGVWLTPAEIADRAQVKQGVVLDTVARFMLNQVHSVRDGMQYVMASREVPGKKFKLKGNRCQIRVVPNTFDDTGWRRGRPVQAKAERHGHPLLVPLRPAAVGIA
jgi:hypothetical protein